VCECAFLSFYGLLTTTSGSESQSQSQSQSDSESGSLSGKAMNILTHCHMPHATHKYTHTTHTHTHTEGLVVQTMSYCMCGSLTSGFKYTRTERRESGSG